MNCGSSQGCCAHLGWQRVVAPCGSKIHKKHIPAWALAPVTPWMCSKGPGTLLGGLRDPTPDGLSPLSICLCASSCTSSHMSPGFVSRHCPQGLGPPAPGHPLSPRGLAWQEGGTEINREAKCEKQEVLFQNLKAPKRAEPVLLNVAKCWKEVDTLSEFSSRAAGAVPQQCHSCDTVTSPVQPRSCSVGTTSTRVTGRGRAGYAVSHQHVTLQDAMLSLKIPSRPCFPPAEPSVLPASRHSNLGRGAAGYPRMLSSRRRPRHTVAGAHMASGSCSASSV